MSGKTEQLKDQTLRFMDKGRFVRVDFNFVGSERREPSDRRSTLKGDPQQSETGQERRVGARRLDDVTITIEIKDEKGIYVNQAVFKEIVKKMLQTTFPEICKNEGQESFMNLGFGSKEIYIETKMRYRDQIKNMITRKGLSFEVIDNGVYIGKVPIKIEEVKSTIQMENPEIPEAAATHISAILGFKYENIKEEIDNVIFKVFLKCLNEVHPVSGDYERDALKQNVSLEQRIIFIAGKHYPKSKNYTFETIIEQVFAECIKAYNSMIQLEAEIHGLQERYRLHPEGGLKTVIAKKGEILQRLKESSLEETMRTLYLYLSYFKDLIMVGSIRGRIENVFKKVNDRQLKILNLEEVYQQLNNILNVEKQIKERKPQNYTKLLGYIEWLKNEIGTEVYFVRFLWINNLRGKSYIDDAIKRTLDAISA